VAHMLLIAALLASAPTNPAAPKPAEESSAQAAKAPEKPICRRVVPTGSIMPVRSCRSQKGWDNLSDGGQDTMRQFRDKSQSSMGKPGD